MHILYAMPASYYSARIRCYLRKMGIAFEERTPGDPRFMAEIVPIVGRWVIPVVVTPEGTVLQDGTDILDHFDRQAPPAARLLPEGALLQVAAHLFPLLGGEGLLKAAMHYRWSFDANLDFLRRDFALSLSPPGACELLRFDEASRRMRRAALSIGVTPLTAPAIEQTYLAFLDALDDHLAGSAYLMGNRATLADYGMIGPLYAHLGRDPYPCEIMKRRAVRVWRWVERMNAPEQDAAEHAGNASASEAVASPSLINVLRKLSDLFAIELRAHLDAARHWLEETERVDGVPAPEQPIGKSLGVATIRWQDVDLSIAILPYRLYLWQRIEDAALVATSDEPRAIDQLLAAIGLSDLLERPLSKRVARRGYQEVFTSRGD